MSEPFQPSGRFHRVTTRRRNLRVLQCPLEPELLVAEFAGELPPEVATAVREHIAVCDICGERSRTLQAPYQVIASLGNQPVPYVPDMRDRVRSRLAHGQTTRRMRRMAATLTRGGGLAAVCVILAVGLIGFLLFGIISASAENLSPSTNQLTHVPAAATTGLLLAETDKIITVGASNGEQWHVAEVIAVNELNGSVVHSLPSSTTPLHPSKPQQLPMATAVSPDGRTIFELTAPNGDHEQALAAFDASTGNLDFVTPVMLPNNAKLPAGEYGDSLAVAPNGSLVYVGLGLAQPAAGGPRVLVYSSTIGTLATTLSPGFGGKHIPMPPPPGSLPVSVFPNALPHLDAVGMSVTLGASGKLVISADGQWLFDEELLSRNGNFQYAIVRRFSTASGVTTQELAIAGDFHISQLAITGVAAQQQQLYLMKSSPDAIVYVLDASSTGPTETGLIDLGGVQAPSGVVFSGAVTLAPTDGTQVYAIQNISAQGGSLVGQDLWLLDTRGMAVEAHLLDNDAVDSVLANPAGSYTAAPYVLRNGEVLLAPDSLQGAVVPWLSLSDGHPIIALLAVVP